MGTAPPTPPASSRAPDLSVLKPAPHISAAWLIVPCLACDGLMMPVLTSVASGSGMAIALGVVGCVLAQGNLLAAWLAWGDEPFLRRLLTHWKIAAGLYLVWLVGFGLVALTNNRLPPQIAAVVALGVPLVSLAAQFPLWLARQIFGWRLVREQAEAAPPSEPPLAIRDLMLATLIVAVALALARLAPSLDAGEMWPVWGVAVFVACVISSISLLPAGALLLRSRLLSRALQWSVLYAAAWIALPWIIVAVVRLYGSVNLPPRALFVGLSNLMFTFAATVTLTAAIARDRGYRLTGGRKRLPVVTKGWA
ncbi:MAG TPA: hypothetical protein VFB96_14980 [Pirellulaceae bacterium]|nr:hypothetical protein [Pirellulaceae bacterium]